ncbi:MAG: type ISP restriction/modification enzyme [Janthinobacterium lividum]
MQRNVIAVEIEKVIGSITAKHFSRDQFLKSLDHFYIPLERAAEQQEDYTEKQHFLNAVYEKFFQSFDPKQADTMGIVYTPQPIVDFMVRSVEEILKQEFGKSLSDEGVHILDPFTGTGNFITRIMQEIKRSALPHKYAHELHCNEIMLLPYYIASMNIEHAYMEKVKEYSPFEGICLVDTFELSEFGQQSFAFSNSNTERVRKQKKQPIFVVIGNPPYNMGQESLNDANANRRYKHWDSRIRDTYTKSSKASNRNKLSDPYVKAFRWASDRIRNGGVIAFVSNNSFIDQIAFDGMRSHLHKDFSKLFVLDLGGNVRLNPKLSGTTHNVFGIQVGVAISFLIKTAEEGKGEIFYARMQEDWRREQKCDQLTRWRALHDAKWASIFPDHRETWLTQGHQLDFSTLLPLVDDERKGKLNPKSVTTIHSLGVNTGCDAWSISFSEHNLLVNVRTLLTTYKEDLLSQSGKADYKRATMDERKIKWTDRLRQSFRARTVIKIDPTLVRRSAYRPFTKQFLYFEPRVNKRHFQLGHMLPNDTTRNQVICWNVNLLGNNLFCLVTDLIPDLHFAGDSQCFPFFIYDTNGTRRRENITDWALNEFRTHYTDDSITKWDIFHATYAILHHPEYRTRYAANLKRELPRIPFPPDFHAFAAAGQRLMELHIDYEQQPEYKLEQIEDPKAEISFRVTKMKLSKDKTELRYNDFLLLRGIPAGVYDYRLGNRSALEWVIDQYQVSTDKRSGIVNDPNRKDDPKYILRLIGQVITVSLETNSIIGALPTLGLPDAEQTTETPLIKSANNTR